MTDIRKYVENKSQEELLETQRNSVVGGDVYKAVTFEIQRIQQDTNNIQIAKLIGEMQQLKEIADLNAKTATKNALSDRRLASTAIVIAVVGLIFQTILGVHHKVTCRTIGKLDTVTEYYGCQREVDLGAFGTLYFDMKDFKVVK